MIILGSCRQIVKIKWNSGSIYMIFESWYRACEKHWDEIIVLNIPNWAVDFILKSWQRKWQKYWDPIVILNITDTAGDPSFWFYNYDRKKRSNIEIPFPNRTISLEQLVDRFHSRAMIERKREMSGSHCHDDSILLDLKETGENWEAKFDRERFRWKWRNLMSIGFNK